MGPFHKSCNCRCLPPFPCIEGCAKSGNFSYDNVILNMTAPTWSYYTDSDTFTYNGGTANVNVYIPDISAVGGGVDLRRRPNSSAFGYGQRSGVSECQWLWNNPLDARCLWLSPNFVSCTGVAPYVQAYTSHLATYEPVNAIDSTSPWDRVLLSHTSYLCGSCYCYGCGSLFGNPRGHYRCGNSVFYTSAVLYIAEGGIPGGTAPYDYDTTYYNPFGTGYWYWVLDFKMFGGVASWSYNKSTVGPVVEIHIAGGPNSVLGKDAALPNFGGYDVGGILQDGAVEGVDTLQYAKLINCSTDFEGDPITLDFHLETRGDATRFTLDTKPSTLTIELYP